MIGCVLPHSPCRPPFASCLAGRPPAGQSPTPSCARHPGENWRARAYPTLLFISRAPRRPGAARHPPPTHTLARPRLRGPGPANRRGRRGTMPPRRFAPAKPSWLATGVLAALSHEQAPVDPRPRMYAAPSRTRPVASRHAHCYRPSTARGAPWKRRAAEGRRRELFPPAPGPLETSAQRTHSHAPRPAAPRAARAQGAAQRRRPALFRVLPCSTSCE